MYSLHQVGRNYCILSRLVISLRYFVLYSSGTNNGGDFPQESLKGIYHRIKKVFFLWFQVCHFGDLPLPFPHQNLLECIDGVAWHARSSFHIYSFFRQQKAFVTGRDHVSVVEKLSKKIVGTKSPWTVGHWEEALLSACWICFGLCMVI